MAARRHPALRRTAAAAATVTGAGTARGARPVAVRAVPLEWTARPTRTETVWTSARLAYGEFRNRPRHRWLALARQRGADQRAMHGAFIVSAIAVCVAVFVGVDRDLDLAHGIAV